ncbi:hypothetical protein EYF80_012480 [Liparis tanakae]|uniref:Uncharacterized protein n=1 Tax=Liparis tanakae TaxID=230148 RepID=A0A4Z2IHE6_9TELE|nr:hypothetical protein EYF80_012480 [Liparis tanakae]
MLIRTGSSPNERTDKIKKGEVTNITKHINLIEEKVHHNGGDSRGEKKRTAAVSDIQEEKEASESSSKFTAFLRTLRSPIVLLLVKPFRMMPAGQLLHLSLIFLILF